jgi:hypothetical protein
MNLRVTETAVWSDIEKAATAAGTCIRPGGVNNERARESFEAGGVKYFLQETRNPQYQWTAVGYARLHQVSERTDTELWIADYVVPFCYRAVRLVWKQLESPLLVHKWASDDWDLAENWPSLPLKLSKVSEFKFRQCQGSYESIWLLVS